MDLGGHASTLSELIKKINKTNCLTEFQPGKTLTDALVERDVILLKRRVLDSVVHAASIKLDRYSKSEVIFLSTVNIAQLQKQIDDLSKNHRELDFKIQELNWKTELL